MLLLSDGWKTARYYDYRTGKLNIVDNVEARVDGKFRYKDSKKLITINTKSQKYPLVDVNKSGKTSRFRVHIIIASTFKDEIPSIPGLFVDHIDRNVQNFSICNLRFVTPSENNKNKTKTKVYSYYAVFNNDDLKVTRLYKESEITWKDLKYSLEDNESFYLIVDNLFDKLSKMNIDTNDIVIYLNSLTWATLNKNYSISSLGIVKVNKTRLNTIKFTLGSLGNSGYYRLGTGLPNRSRFIHVLVAEMFLNDGNKIDDSLVVDHIDTDKMNNSVGNLRIVTQSQNMRNELTTYELRKPIKCKFNGEFIYFKSIVDCAKIIGVCRNSVGRWVSGKQKNLTHTEFSDFKYLTENEINSNLKYVESRDDIMMK
jgi:hypothetical protein